MSKVFLSEMTWPEIEETLKETDVAILPIGCIEEHGPHLPINTDTLIASYISEQVANELLDKFRQRIVVVAPAIPYGETMLTYLPGTLNIKAETLIQLVKDICESLARQGFKKIILLNAHFGNQAPLTVVGRELVYEMPDVTVVMVNWWSLASDIIPDIRETDVGGMFHACELETSVCLAIQPENVHLDRVTKESMATPFSRKFWAPEMFFPQKVSWFYSRKDWPKSGFVGDSTKATKEKGEKVLSAVIGNLAEFILELKKK